MQANQPQVTQQDVVVREYTPENITTLKPNEVFVFGSNTEGRHGLGAALTAKKEFGAKYGQAKGPQGQSYAVRTKMYQDGKLVEYNNLTEENKKQMDLMTIEDLRDLRFEALKNPDKKYYVTLLGTKLAGRTVQQMKDFFQRMDSRLGIPDNIILPKEFEVREQVELKTKQDAWSNLSLQQMTNLGKKGITKELFNNSSTEEQNKLIKCHG
jgi:hypothetical protein